MIAKMTLFFRVIAVSLAYRQPQFLVPERILAPAFVCPTVHLTIVQKNRLLKTLNRRASQEVISDKE